MVNSGTLPFTIYNMIINMGMRYCLWVYDWLLESILWSYFAFMLSPCAIFDVTWLDWSLYLDIVSIMSELVKSVLYIVLTIIYKQ